MKLRLSHCSIRRSLKTVQRLHQCGPGVHSPCYPRHMNPPELAGWPGTHSPCSPRSSWQGISCADGTSWRSIRYLPRAWKGRHSLATGDHSVPFPRAWKGRHEPVAGGTAGAVHAALDAGSGGRCVHRASFPARRKTCSGAAYCNRLIRGLPPSACLPFQARGKAPDQSLAASMCLLSQVRGKAPDQSLAASMCLLSQARGKAPDQSLACERVSDIPLVGFSRSGTRTGRSRAS
jgi:hypothetical protein